MPFRYDIQIDTDVIDALQDAIARAPKTVQTFITKTLVNDSLARIRAQTQPPPPNTNADYPLRWKSERQRRFVMAKLRNENNLPYQRTGQLTASWFVKVTGGIDPVIEIGNTSPYIDFVAGVAPERQPMFPRWYSYPDILLEEEEIITNAVIDLWGQILDTKSGVFR